MLRFAETQIAGAFLVETDEYRDERGGFSRLYCPEEFKRAGIDFSSTQINLSANPHRHTLRGLHFQPEPHAEAKFVRCLNGAIHDVIVDLRPESSSYLGHQAFELSRENRLGLFVPEGCAHGFLTLREDCDILYQMSRVYEPGYAAGYRYDDPAFAIAWPAPPAVIAQADLDWPAFAP
ncbi:dTDP-4-dehydrorhamnose 3,5-epimerase family protein [Stappia sp. F7233]|uniref:dTDP-4-dehydrorhamnose 3,5-epimerase n=1 Tax=Stappia albiluteola TaxID=2758565 RepID=A0A839AJ62_9HYPH|nr:dTDP-4-dehydrorhamnose 3,5-epimerase family protein [Stappia albiluteola]MBA5778539.1 dTDP-4-dehydrorhamnose 3,5-epimerase family protein [Stappia albiluteola]